jgi:hypothetical protein
VSCFPPCSIESAHIPCSCSQKELPITRVVHQSFAEVPHCCFSAYKVVFHWHRCHHCAGETTVNYLPSPLRSCFSIISLLVSHPYTWYRTPPSLLVLCPSVSVFPTPQYLWYQVSVSLPCSRTRITNSALISPPSALYHYTPLILLSIIAILPYPPQYLCYFYIPLGLFIENTQSFPMEQSSLQLYHGKVINSTQTICLHLRLRVHCAYLQHTA